MDTEASAAYSSIQNLRPRPASSLSCTFCLCTHSPREKFSLAACFGIENNAFALLIRSVKISCFFQVNTWKVSS
jgi:hypothetical protein